MIMNERQYRITREAAEKFRLALEAPRTPSRSVHPKMAKVARGAMAAQLQGLEREIEAYEALQRGRPTLEGILQDLGGLLVYARIARKWTQQELADRVGVKLQQIQRYEQTLYASASLTRLQEVAAALGVTSHVKLKLVLLLDSLKVASAATEQR